MPAEPRPEKRARRGSLCMTRIADLPLEILILIFQHAAAMGGLFTSLSLTHTCHSWRNIALSMQHLWRDARIGIAKIPRDRDNRVKGLLSVCAQRSSNTITHADLQHFSNTRTFSVCLEILGRSAGTLVNLDINYNQLCHCLSCTPEGAPDLAKSRHFRFGGLEKLRELRFAGESLISLLSRASRLQRLVLNHRFVLVRNYRQICAARPRELTIVAPVTNRCSASGLSPEDSAFSKDHSDFSASTDIDAPTSLKGFFEQLVSNAAMLSLRDKDPRTPWDSWPNFANIGMSLRCCHLPLSRVLQIAARPFRDFPLLEDLRMGDLETSGAEDVSPLLEDTGIWMNTPALQRMYATPSIAAKIRSPLVRSAFLQVRDAKDIEVLPRLLKSWTRLKSLTLEVVDKRECTNRARDDPWVLRAFEDIVCIFTPSRCGAVRSPKLRHLGLLASRLAQHSAPDTPSTRSDWASVPWWGPETDWWYSDRYRALMHKTTTPQIGGNLFAMEFERRHLSQKGRRLVEASSEEDVKDVDEYVHGPCAALEIIKLGGIDVDFAVWDHMYWKSPAEVTCHPRPRDTRFSYSRASAAHPAQ